MKESLKHSNRIYQYSHDEDRALIRGFYKVVWHLLVKDMDVYYK